MELRQESSGCLVFDFAFNALGHQQNAYRTKQVDEAGESANRSKVIIEIHDQHRGNEDCHGGDDAAEIKANAGTG